jgi:uncharacterized RDD family membrane protein YckC
MEKKFIIPNYILASKNTRFLHFIIDLGFIYLISLIIYFLSSFIKLNTVYPHFSDWIYTFDRAESFIFKSIIWFFYYGITEFFFSRTFAKYFTKTVVVLKDGSKPKFSTILTRTLLRIVPFEYFTFLRGREPGWHDKYSGTFVVNENKLKESLSDFNESKNNSYVISN